MSDTNEFGVLQENGFVTTPAGDLTSPVADAQAASQAVGDALTQKANEPAAPAPETPAPDDKFAAKFAALGRKEKEIREREGRLKELEAKLQEQETTAGDKYKGYDDFDSRLAKDPLGVLAEKGLTYEQLTQMVLDSDGKPGLDMRMGQLQKDIDNKYDTKLKELEARLAERDKKDEDSAAEASLGEFMTQLTTFVNDNEEYELIRANDSVDLVYTVIENHHTETGEVMTTKEAADAVENHLLEQAKKHLGLGKIKKLLEAQAPGAEPKKEVQPSPTLTNTQASEGSYQGEKKLSREESLAESAKHIRWNE